MPASESGRYNSYVSEETLVTVAQEWDGVKGGAKHLICPQHLVGAQLKKTGDL
ncbi:MAG: hypothetical protein NVS9B14_23830 [Candidatus Acidiferrum sp.]